MSTQLYEFPSLSLLYLKLDLQYNTWVATLEIMNTLVVLMFNYSHGSKKLEEVPNIIRLTS